MVYWDCGLEHVPDIAESNSGRAEQTTQYGPADPNKTQGRNENPKKNPEVSPTKRAERTMNNRQRGIKVEQPPAIENLDQTNGTATMACQT